MITILIPTHNRSSYLSRNLNFLSGHDSIFNLVIADSSDPEFFRKNDVLVRKYSDRLNISVIDCRGMDIFSKYVFSLSRIDSQFVAVCGDDDFIVPAVAEKCAAFLAENCDYSLAQGKIVTFTEGVSINRPLNTLRYYPQMSNEMEFVDRVVAHFHDYRNSFYSVHRTELLLDNFKRVGELDIGRGLKERLLSALDSVQGKRKMFHELFLLRQKGLTGVDERGARTFKDNPADANYFNDISFGYDCYCNFLSDYISSKIRLSQDEMRRITQGVEADFSMWEKIRGTSRSISKSGSMIFAYRRIRGTIESWIVRLAVGQFGRKELLRVEEVMRCPLA